MDALDCAVLYCPSETFFRKSNRTVLLLHKNLAFYDRNSLEQHYLKGRYSLVTTHKKISKAKTKLQKH